jgi:hypothetical protein
VEEELRNNNFNAGSFDKDKKAESKKSKSNIKTKEVPKKEEVTNKRAGRSSKLSKDNRPSSPDDGALNLSVNSNEDGFKDDS